jgi:hypothetical protein
MSFTEDLNTLNPQKSLVNRELLFGVQAGEIRKSIYLIYYYINHFHAQNIIN